MLYSNIPSCLFSKSQQRYSSLTADLVVFVASKSQERQLFQQRQLAFNSRTVSVAPVIVDLQGHQAQEDPGVEQPPVVARGVLGPFDPWFFGLLVHHFQVLVGGCACTLI